MRPQDRFPNEPSARAEKDLDSYKSSNASSNRGSVGRGSARPIYSKLPLVSPTLIGTVTDTEEQKATAQPLAADVARAATRVRQAMADSKRLFENPNEDTARLLGAFDRYFSGLRLPVVQEDRYRKDVSAPGPERAYYDPVGDRIRFTSRFAEQTEFEKILTIIHEALHAQGSSLAQLETGGDRLGYPGIAGDNAGDWDESNPVFRAFHADVDGAAMTLMKVIWPELNLSEEEIGRERLDARTRMLFETIIEGRR